MLKRRCAELGLIGLISCGLSANAEGRNTWEITQSSAHCRTADGTIKKTLTIEPCPTGESAFCHQVVGSNGAALSLDVENDTTTLTFFGADCETIGTLIYPGHIPSALGINTKHGAAYAFLTNFPKAQEATQDAAGDAAGADEEGCDDGPAIPSIFVMWSLSGKEQLRLGPHDFSGGPPTVISLDDRYAWYPTVTEGLWGGDQFLDFQTSKAQLASYSPPEGTSGMTGAGTVERRIKRGGLIEISAVEEYIKPTGKRVSLNEFNALVLKGYPDWLELLQSMKPVRKIIYEGHLP